MAYPVIIVTPPATIVGQPNGKLPPSLLVPTPGLQGGPTVTMVAAAARSWRAMSGTALQQGILLQATSTADTYRTYPQQVNLFTTRFVPDPYPGWSISRYWERHEWPPGTWVNGHTWYLRQDQDLAAVPGHSNHGLGLAIDIRNASGARLDWLLANALRFGFSWETQSEAWHIRYVRGDNIPAAVITYEQSGGDVSLTPEQDQRLEMVDADTRVLLTGQPTIGPNPFYPSTTPVWLVNKINQMDADLAALKAGVSQILQALSGGVPAPGAGATPAQVEEIVDRQIDQAFSGGADDDIPHTS